MKTPRPYGRRNDEVSGWHAAGFVGVIFVLIFTLCIARAPSDTCTVCACMYDSLKRAFIKIMTAFMNDEGSGWHAAGTVTFIVGVTIAVVHTLSPDMAGAVYACMYDSLKPAAFMNDEGSGWHVAGTVTFIVGVTIVMTCAVYAYMYDRLKPGFVKTAFMNDEGSGPGCHVPGTVIFAVGGRSFQISERLIRTRGQSLLSDLLDDPGRGDLSLPVYVDGDCNRFKYVLDWFRYGKVQLPPHLTLSEMKREFEFYGIGDAVGDMARWSGLAAVEEIKKRAHGSMVVAMRACYVMLECSSRYPPATPTFPSPTGINQSIRAECAGKFMEAFDRRLVELVNEILRSSGLKVALDYDRWKRDHQWNVSMRGGNQKVSQRLQGRWKSLVYKSGESSSEWEAAVIWGRHTSKLIAASVETTKALILLLAFIHADDETGCERIVWDADVRARFKIYVDAADKEAFSCQDWIEVERAVLDKQCSDVLF